MTCATSLLASLRSVFMQKFTVFSILLSLTVVLVMSDFVWNKPDEMQNPNDVPDTQDSYDTIPAEDLPTETPTELPPNVPQDLPEEDANVDLSQESLLYSQLDESIFQKAGFTQPVLKDNLYSGLVFQFISFNDQSAATIYQWNLFDGEQFIGSISEIRFPSETSGFQGYLALRDKAQRLTDLGEVNEVNNYGDASFYFNHKVKTKTIHIVIRNGTTVYAFEYAQTYHEKMKNMFDILGASL